MARYYDITGEKRYEPCVRQGMDQVWQDINKAGTSCKKGGNWYLGIYARGVITACHATGDERMRDLAIGCADWAMTYEVNPKHGYAYQQFPDPWNHKPEDRGKALPEKYKDHWFPQWANSYMIDLFAHAYHQTGDRRYLAAMEFAWDKHGDDWALGYFPTAMYMAYGPRADKTAPAAVTDLKAIASDAQVTLTWTAPGDDGDKGTASVYQIKHAAKPILEFVPFPEKMRTHITFWGSENVADEPAPKAAGASHSYTVGGLKPGRYYFALKTRDECSNQSPISNVATATVK